MTETPADEHDIDLLLKAQVERVARALEQGAGSAGRNVAPSQRRVLCLLGTMGSLTQQRLLDELELAPASLSEVIGKLASKGLITRDKLESDRRIMVIALTPAGRTTAEEMLAAESASANRTFARLTPEEKQQLEALLERISVPVG